MISTILAANPWLSRVALVVLLVGTAAVVALLRRRPRVLWVLAAAALAAIIFVTMLPGNPLPPRGCFLTWRFPFTSLQFPYLTGIEQFANVVLFVPAVALAGVAARRPVMMFGLGVLLSAAIELVQLALPVLGRSCDSNDFVCNALGAAVGGVIALIVVRTLRDRGSTAS